jgi:ABC-type bacteriocin/lantibiotic exporter with double-glycine peptidase domain
VTVAVVVVGVYLIGERTLTLGALVAASMPAARALAPAGQIVGLLMQFQGARTALDGLDKLMAQPVGPRVPRPAPAAWCSGTNSAARSSFETCISATRTARPAC